MLQLILFLSLIAASAASCNRTCGENKVPYPFGFSSSCPIQLSCNSTNSDISLSGFPVRSFTANNTFSLNISADCNHPLTDASAFFSNCNQSWKSQCLIPTLVVSQMSHQVANCSERGANVTCFFNNTASKPYLSKEELPYTLCENIFTSVLYEPSLAGQMALSLGLVEIGWWMTGTCSCIM